MKISVSNLEPTKLKLSVTVEANELKPYLDQTYAEIGKQISVPGFRRGHVPHTIIDHRLGFGAVAQEAANHGVPELYSKALREKSVHPMAQPKLNVDTLPKSAAEQLAFTAEVEVRPQVDLPGLKGLEIEVPKPEVSEEDVNRRLEALRQRFGTLTGVDRPARKGDYASIDLDAAIDGKSVDSQEGVSYQLGSGTMLDGLDEALDGLSAGEETTFEGVLEAGEHQGEKAQIKVKVNTVKTEELPKLDDDFAKDASEFDTLDELKADIRKQSRADAEGRQATGARDRFLAKLEADKDIPVPSELKSRLVDERLKHPQSGSDSEPSATNGKDDKATSDAARKKTEQDVEKELRDQIVLDTLAETLGVQVQQTDVTNFLASMAQQYGMDPNHFIKGVIDNGQLGAAVQEVGRSKAMIAGMRAVTFKDADGKPVDLSRFLHGPGESEHTGEQAEEKESVEAASAAAAVADQLASNDDDDNKDDSDEGGASADDAGKAGGQA